MGDIADDLMEAEFAARVDRMMEKGIDAEWTDEDEDAVTSDPAGNYDRYMGQLADRAVSSNQQKKKKRKKRKKR